MTMSVARSVPLICALVAAAGVASARDSASMTSEIIGTIEDFEAEQDAKCYATATRLENFIYGTPLSADARFLKIDLQKQVILDLWQAASADARSRSAAQVTAEDVKPRLDEILDYALDADRNVSVKLEDRTLVLSERDFRHYSSIAYALRAILAVQQDQLWSNGPSLVPLDPGAVDAIRTALDVMTLSALALADENARRDNSRELSPDHFALAWLDVTGIAGASQMAEAPAASVSPATGPPPTFSTFGAIVDQKIKSYADYNEIEESARADLFLQNVQRFYARYYVPPGGLTLPEAVGRAAEGFLQEILKLAEASAAKRGERLLRAHDLNDALQAVTPHVVDDLEDATFFPNLSDEDRVVLAAFDLDSFRDFGMHWRLIRVMLETGRVSMTMEPDPFAAELIAEGMAQYAVLLMRIAGRVARSHVAPPFVEGHHLDRAAGEIRRLAGLNNTTAVIHKPVTAIESTPGKTAEAAGTFMTDVTAEMGIDFEHRSSEWLNRFRRDVPVVPPTFSGGGLAAGDVNGDGLEDLLFAGGLGNALYLNEGRKGFRKAHAPQLQQNHRDGLPAEARQPIIADFDNDGDQDVLITYVDAPHQLKRNIGGGAFEDATAGAGLGGEGRVEGPATVFDFDRDGLLDVYLCGFGDYIKGYSGKAAESASADDFPGELPLLERNNTNGLPNRLLRNRGGLRFQEVEDSGAEDGRWCQAVGHTDFDGDGWQDLVIANDFGRNALLRNTGKGRFEDVSESLGMTHSYHSMNVGLADLNRDLFPDIYVSNINMMAKDNRYVLPSEKTTVKLGPEEMAGVHITETSMLYLSESRDGKLESYGSSNSVERGNAVGWAWDAEFFDFDNDGDDDLYVLNGANEYFVYLAHRDIEGQATFDFNMESNVFYVNEDGALRNRSNKSGADFQGNSRAAVYTDFDRDGDLDVALNNFHRGATFFRNDLAVKRHFVRLRLEGRPEAGSNRDAIGARILATTPDGKQIWREIHGGSGYLSMEPKIQHIGLGESRTVDLEIRWPGGSVQKIEGVAADRSWHVREGQAPKAVRER